MSYTFHTVKEKKGRGGRQGRRVKEGQDDDRDRGMRGGMRKEEEEDRGEEEEGGRGWGRDTRGGEALQFGSWAEERGRGGE